MFRTELCMVDTSSSLLVCNILHKFLSDKKSQHFPLKGNSIFFHSSRVRLRYMYILKYIKLITPSSKYISALFTDNSNQPLNISSKYNTDINAYSDVRISYSYKAVKFNLLLLNYITYYCLISCLHY